MNPSVEQLLKVQEVDSQMIFLRESMRLRPRELEDDRRKVTAAKAAAEAVAAQIKSLKVESDRREIDVRKADSEIEKLTVALNQAKSNQEYTILKEQIKRQEDLRGQAEEEVLEKLTHIDTLEARRKELSQSLVQAEGALKKKQAEVDELMAGIKKELESLAKARQELIAGVEAENLRIYDRILERHNNFAVARVDGQVCQGCYMAVTTQEVNLLLQGQFLQCKSCSRILYLPPG
jgi:hypothetical protein